MDGASGLSAAGSGVCANRLNSQTRKLLSQEGLTAAAITMLDRVTSLGALPQDTEMIAATRAHFVTALSRIPTAAQPAHPIATPAEETGRAKPPSNERSEAGIRGEEHGNAAPMSGGTGEADALVEELDRKMPLPGEAEARLVLELRRIVERIEGAEPGPSRPEVFFTLRGILELGAYRLEEEPALLEEARGWFGRALDVLPSDAPECHALLVNLVGVEGLAFSVDSDPSPLTEISSRAEAYLAGMPRGRSRIQLAIALLRSLTHAQALAPDDLRRGPIARLAAELVHERDIPYRELSAQDLRAFEAGLMELAAADDAACHPTR